jgi:hypothetical protein
LNMSGCEAAMDAMEKVFGRREKELKWQRELGQWVRSSKRAHS